MTATITRADGVAEEVRGPPLPGWHDSFRYYRLALVTDDPFDAFRNLWLALELALSSHTPPTPREGEKAWLRRALIVIQADAPCSLAYVAAPADPMGAFLTDFYEDTRCRLFHAKGSRPRLHSQDLANRAQVIDCFSRMLPLVRAVLAKVAGAPTGGGTMTYQGFATLMAQAHAGGAIFLSRRAGNLAADETLEDPVWEGVLKAPHHWLAGESGGGRELFGCRVTTGTDACGRWTRMGLVFTGANSGDETLFSAARFEDPLSVDTDFDVLEPVMGIEMVNLSTPRTRFLL